MSQTSALLIETAAFTVLNVFQPGDTIPDADAQSALGFLNRMVSSLRQQSLTIPVVARETFDLTANKGGPSNPYTIGTGGDFNTQKPPSQQSIVGVGLLLNSSSPVVEIPRALFTDDAWEAVQVKELTNELFTDLYYNPTYATSDLGTINLWPVPNTSANDIALYLSKALVSFSTLTATYYIPDAYEEMLVYNLARRMVTPWGAPSDVAADVMDMARNSLSLVKRTNVKMTDLPTDPAITANNRFSYNIQTGLGG